MPTDWQRSLMTLAVTVLTVTVIAVSYFARSILIPIALAVFFTFVLSPMVTWLQRRGLGRTPSVMVIVGLVFLVAVGIGSMITHEVVLIAQSLPDREQEIKKKVIAAKSWLTGGGDSKFSKLVDGVDEILFPKRPAHETVVVESPTPPLTAQLQPFINPSVEILGQMALTSVLTIYMLIRREDLRNRMIRLIGDGRVTTTTKAVDEASRKISGYLLMQAAINSVFGLTIALGLLLLGVKYVLLWGFIATVMRYVPYIGTWIGLLPPVLFSFATAPDWGGGWGQPLVVLAMYVGFELICANVFEPWLYGSSMGLSEVAQLVAAAFWAFLWGPIGLILAGPLTGCLLVFGKYVRGAEFLEVLLGDEPALEPRIAFYQRLAARDQDEAGEIAMAVAKAKGAENALETVIIPALCLVRREHEDGEIDQSIFRYAIHAAREIAAEIEDLIEPASPQPNESQARVLICPARDEAENIAADILAATLEPGKWEVKVAGSETLASELVTTVEAFQPNAVVLVALPPGGLVHCRYLVNRIRKKFPSLRVIIGRWGDDDVTQDVTPSQDAKGLKQVDALERSFSETRKHLNDLHSVLVTEKEKQDAEKVQPAKDEKKQEYKQEERENKLATNLR